jgi:hypothetical protein
LKDKMKKEYAKNAGITLIEIPFWWDKSIDSLAATIRSTRMDLSALPFGQQSKPIDSQIPVKSIKPFVYRPNVPQKYSDKLNLSGW